MSTQVKETSSHLFDYLALALIIAGIGLFYSLHINIWFKWAIVLVSITGAVESSKTVLLLLDTLNSKLVIVFPPGDINVLGEYVKLSCIETSLP